MTTDSEEGLKIAASLAHRIGRSAEGASVVDAIVSILEEISAALVPILGSKGVAALYRRSLYLCATAHPSFADAFEDASARMDLTRLKVLLLEQDRAEVVLFGEHLLKAFYELLATLIGPSLTARLLRTVWENSLSVHPEQDTSL